MRLPVIDLHADTYAKKLLVKRQPVYKNFIFEKFPDKTDFTDITKQNTVSANVRIQTQSLYLYSSFMDKPLANAMGIVSGILEYVRENNDYVLIKTLKDIDLQNKYGILMSIEGLEVIEGNLDLLDVFYELGVRVIAPTWNRLTPWLSPVTEKTGAFRAFPDLVNKLNQFKVILDISHLSDQSVIDLEKNYQGTLIATHSNIRDLNTSARNLSADLIEIIKERQGLIGINFYPEFLKSDFSGIKKDNYPESYYWILNMIEYLDRKSALDCIAFGTDFDGVFDYCEGLEDYSAFVKVYDFFVKQGLSNDLIEKIFYKNALSVLERNLEA